MWVKICANTCAGDAVEAAELGADAVGFVFAPSKRQVDVERVREIAGELPENVERVGVFGDLPAEEIARMAERARLTAVQLHGGYDRARTERLLLLLPGVALIQTAHWAVGQDAGALREVKDRLSEMKKDAVSRKALGERVLIDAKVGGASGGTGVAFDWSSAAELFGVPGGLRMILAGGLKPENVAEAIRTVRPWGVDVASGVEREIGRKDPARVKEFIENARGARSKHLEQARPGHDLYD